MKRKGAKLPERTCRSRRHENVWSFGLAAWMVFVTLGFQAGLWATNEPPGACATAVLQPTNRFLLDAEASRLPKDRLLDRAWATPAAGELLQRLHREYPADQAQIDVYLACWNYFNGNPFEAKAHLRRLGREQETAQALYLQLVGREGDWPEIKKIAAATNLAVSVRSAAYLKLQNRAERAGRKEDAAIYERARQALPQPESQAAAATVNETSEKARTRKTEEKPNENP